LATTASGKGLGSFPGLSMVFHDYTPKSEPARLPGYLDLGHWHESASVPHTHSSNLVNALAVAVSLATSERMQRIADNAAWLRASLVEAGFRVLALGDSASPGIVTVVMGGDTGMKAAELGDELEMRGFWLSYRSCYLLECNWIQVALLGDPEREKLEKLVRVMRVVCGRRRESHDSICAADKSHLSG